VAEAAVLEVEEEKEARVRLYSGGARASAVKRPAGTREAHARRAIGLRATRGRRRARNPRRPHPPGPGGNMVAEAHVPRATRAQSGSSVLVLRRSAARRTRRRRGRGRLRGPGRCCALAGYAHTTNVVLVSAESRFASQLIRGRLQQRAHVFALRLHFAFL
jgi:hypothetical protein